MSKSQERRLVRKIADRVVDILQEENSIISDKWLTRFVIFETIIGIGIVSAIVWMTIVISDRL